MRRVSVRRNKVFASEMFHLITNSYGSGFEKCNFVIDCLEIPHSPETPYKAREIPKDAVVVL